MTIDIPSELSPEEIAKSEQTKSSSYARQAMAQAIQQSIFELIGENRTEIVRRASAKLKAMGIPFSDQDMEQAT